MSAIAQPKPQPKKPFAKRETKWQWRLAAGRLAPGIAEGKQGKVLEVMSLTAYKTARDIANALRIEPHVAQGALMKMLAKGAVERRIIPGSVYDVAPTEAKQKPEFVVLDERPDDFEPFDKRIRAGSIIGHDSWDGGFVKKLVIATIRHLTHGYGFQVADDEGNVHQSGFALCHKYWKFVEQTPNPIAFNQGRYAECFEAPKPEPKPTCPFKVGDKITGSINGYVYEVTKVNNDGTMTLRSHLGVDYYNVDPTNYKAGVLAPAWQEAKDSVRVVEPVVDNPVKPAPVSKLNGIQVGDTVEFIDPFNDGIHVGRQDVVIGFHEGFVDLKNLGDGWLLKRFKKVARRFHVARPELLPMEVLSEVSKVFGVGADKYSRDDWAKPDNGGGDHLAAAERHLAKFKDGNVVEGGENGSGLHHIDHAIARLMMLRGKALRNG